MLTFTVLEHRHLVLLDGGQIGLVRAGAAECCARQQQQQHSQGCGEIRSTHKAHARAGCRSSNEQ